MAWNKITVDVGPEVKERFELEAEREYRSLTHYVKNLLMQHYAKLSAAERAPARRTLVES